MYHTNHGLPAQPDFTQGEAAQKKAEVVAWFVLQLDTSDSTIRKTVCVHVGTHPVMQGHTAGSLAEVLHALWPPC